MTGFDRRSGDAGGEDFADVLVSRPDIARLAGVKRPAVTNWERRHADFPSPAARDGEPGDAPGAGLEKFRAGEVLAWLSGRAVPANALHPGEPAGTTYGDRFRAGLTGGAAGGLLRTVKRLAGPEADRLRGPMPLDRYLEWLLFFVVIRILEPGDLPGTVDSLTRMVRDYDPPEKAFPRGLLGELPRMLDRVPPGSPEEAREAFDHVLVLWRAAYAREGGQFLTPPSVTRVMAGALAAVRPGAVNVHDPYGRTGELLVAYLDAVAERGGTPPPRLSGRAPAARERQVAGMSLRVHHGCEVRLGEGPVTPALGPADPPAAFDLVLTNPPFGRLPDDVAPPAHWTYGPVRRTEFDWLQYVVSRLAPGGRAAVLMPAGAAFNEGAAGVVRAGLVDAGAVECVVALPAGLFTLTAVKTHIWFLRAPGAPAPPDDEVLFVDGEGLGHRVSRTRSVLADDDIARLVGEYVSWRAARTDGRAFAGTPGLGRSVPLGDIAAQGHRLDPALHVRAPARTSASAGDRDEVRNRLAGLAGEIEALHLRAEAVDAEAARLLRRYGL
ncbi:N-6 DNA methylase [Streptomyces sp. NPDC052701]|uniref:N-6 DNA methylase n=1 Tax=Streptomyces sp. NPDC052701 TaxID=3155533 RepID=UPI00341891CB